MKKIDDTLTAEELARFAKHNRSQAACFPEYSDFFEKRAMAAETVLSCFWGSSIEVNLMSTVSASGDPVEEEEMEIPWEV